MQYAGTHYIYHPSRSDTLRIWALADIHLGNLGCHKELLARHIAEIADDPLSYWVGLGDYADYVHAHDPRFDPELLDPDIPARDIGRLGKYLTTHVRDIFAPIKEKCIGLVYGNHEFQYMKRNDSQDQHAWLCTELGVPNLGYSFRANVCFIRRASAKRLYGKVHRFRDDKVTGSAVQVRLYGHHGAGAAATPSGKARRLQLFMEQWNADIYFIGHVHGKQNLTLVRGSDKNGCTEPADEVRIGSITGSYLKSYPPGAQAGYGERAGYSLAPLGATVLEYTPETHEASISMRATVGVGV